MSLSNTGLALSLAMALALTAPAARAALSGPVFPAPGGTTFTSSGTSSGDAGGKTLNFSALQLAGLQQLFWGPGAPSTVALSPVAPTTLIFDPSVSSLPSGIARFTATGVAYNSPTPGMPSGPLRVRLTLTQVSPSPALIAAPSEIASAGVVVNAFQTGSAFSVNLLFEAEYPPNSGVFVPVNQLAQSVPGTTQTNFTGGFFSAAAVPAPASGTTSGLLLFLMLPGLGFLALRSRSRQLRSAE